jgi:tRNA threonylcarbamoyl adenosine modification protein YeaZ
MILAIDVSGQLGLLTLELPGGTLLTRHSDLPREHTSFLDRALGELQVESGKPWSELKRVAVTIGPGSFTGLRVGLATAKGLVFDREIPLAPIPSLLVPWRARGEQPGPGLVLRPARSGEVWGALFEGQEPRPVWEKMLDLGQLKVEIEALRPERVTLIGTPPKGDDPWPEMEPELAAEAQLEALSRLARSSDHLVSGPDLDRLLPNYILSPSVSQPKPRPVNPGRRGGRS